MPKFTRSLVALRIIAATSVIISISSVASWGYSVNCMPCDEEKFECDEGASEQAQTSYDSCSGFYEVSGPGQCFSKYENNIPKAFKCSECYKAGYNNGQALLDQCVCDLWSCTDSMCYGLFGF